MKAFNALRVLVRTIVNSVGALGWSMVLLLVLAVIASIFVTQVLQLVYFSSDGVVSEAGGGLTGGNVLVAKAIFARPFGQR